MATLSEYFDTEARDWLVEIDRALSRRPAPDPAELLRAARALRGTAQMAREERVFGAAGALEAAARALASSAVGWGDEFAGRAQQTLDDLRALVARQDDEESLDSRVVQTVTRWSEMGVRIAGPIATAADSAAGAGAAAEFREFAAREVSAIADALDSGVQQLAAEPMDREPLRMILRRQRALLGSARLDDIPVVAEILRAVEDLTRVIAKLDVGVKQEWLDIYRVAREGLKATVEPLYRNEDPEPSHALSRLRHMREELLERYGAGEAVSAAHESGGLVQAAAVQEQPAPVPLRHPDDADASDADTSDADASDADTSDDADASDAAQHDPDAPDLLAAAASAVERAAAAAAPVVSGVAGAVAGAAQQAAGAAQQAAAAAQQTLAGAAQQAAGAAEQAVGAAEQAAGAAEQAVGAAEQAAGAGENGAGAAEQAQQPEVVPIEELEYRGDAALARAQELRGALDRVASHDPQARDAVDELFDLIRIARG
jgi:chemotaxis protein histidine kinase CheA